MQFKPNTNQILMKKYIDMCLTPITTPITKYDKEWQSDKYLYNNLLIWDNNNTKI